MMAAQAITGNDLRGAFCFAVVVLATVFAIQWIVVNVWASGYWVYEIDSDEGDLLYIGYCKNIYRRMKWHESFQRKLPAGHPRNWWPDAAYAVRTSYEPSRKTWYRSKAMAEEAERDRIRRKRPIANVIRYKGASGVGE